MRSSCLSRINNKISVRKIIVISALLLISACSSLSNRLDGPVSSGSIYPLADSFVTSSIAPAPTPDYVASREVTSSALAPVEDVSVPDVAQTVYREPAQGVVIVRPGDTLLGVARQQGVDPVDLAELNALEAPYALNVGEELVLPGTVAAAEIAAKPQTQSTPVARVAAQVKPKKIRTVALPVSKPKPARRLTKRAAAKHATPPKNIKVVKVVAPPKKVAVKRLKKKTTPKPVRIASVKKPKIAKKSPAKSPAVKSPASKREASAGNKFRWPIRGRVISEFGSKSNGAKNDGINLSVPKGAAIVAAESGLVVYSGNELKGFGNLVLIRHKDGWSTAYAHISEMLVKKGQTVRRGQVIAKAGQTGSVSRPQLHFEIRRGTTPVNPRKYLTGTKVARR